MAGSGQAWHHVSGRKGVIATRRRFGRVAVAFSVAASLCGSAMAAGPMEEETGSHISRPAPAEIPLSRMSETDQARATIIAFSQCIVLSHRSAVEQALAIPPLDKQASRALGALAGSDCLRYGELSMRTTMLRGGIYAALYRIDFAKGAAAIADRPLDFSADVQGAVTPDAQQYLWLRQFADCVVRADPADARTLVLSPVASSAENASFAALAPHFNGCAVQGMTLTFSKVILSGLVAEALYREAKAASIATAPAGKSS